MCKRKAADPRKRVVYCSQLDNLAMKAYIVIERIDVGSLTSTDSGLLPHGLSDNTGILSAHHIAAEHH